MDLPKNEYTFQFSEKGEKTKKLYEGSFTVKCLLSMDEIRQAGIKMDILNGGSRTLPPGIALLNRAIAELDLRMIKSPSWWRDNGEGRDLFDSNIVLDVYNKALDAEQDYDKRLTEQAEKAEEEVKAPKASKKKSE